VSLVPTTGIAFTATPSILDCITGVAKTTLTGTTLTSTVVYLLPDGSTSAPSYSFATTVNTGLYSPGVGIMRGVAGGATIWTASIGSFDVGANNLAFTDVLLSRLSADNLLLGPNDKFNIQATALTTTSTDGIISQNTTAALVGTTVQISPRIRLSGTAWDTDDAVSRTVSFFTENLPATGNTVTGTWKLGYIDPVSAVITYPITVASSGTITSIGSFITSNGSVQAGAGNSFQINGRNILSSTADGLTNLFNNAGTVGVQLNTGTAAPTLTACGTGTVSANSRNSFGEITATGATACTVTFGAPNWTNAPFCVVTGDNALITTPYVSARSATAFTVSGLTAGDKFSYHCGGGV
jgi:hypothetical protein